jgi:hypothetical protein
MSDDLDLRLRTAKALGWVRVHLDQRPDRTTLECYERDGHTKWMQYVSDGTIIEALSDLPDYPNTLGACAEVLDAARHRRWRGMFDMAEEEPHKYVHTATFFDPILAHNTWASATAPTLPAAICEAFCEAVEASGE